MSDAGRALARALIARAGAGSHIVAASERPWASLLFEGARHVVDLDLDEVAAGSFAEGIEDAEFVLPGHIVADIVITARAPDDGRASIRLEVLTLIDGALPPERTGPSPRLRGHGRNEAALCR